MTSKYINWKGNKLYRIRALRDIWDGGHLVKKGSLGGYIQHLDNLSQSGSCWVDNDSKVYGNAIVEKNATIHTSRVKSYESDCVEIYGNALITDNAFVGLNSKIGGNMVIEGNTSLILRETFEGNFRIRNGCLWQILR